MEVADGVIALTIGYFAFKGFRAIKERVFLYLHFSFTLLGVGFLAHGLTIGAALGRPIVPALNFGYLVCFATELIAYSLLIFAYLQQTRGFVPGLLGIPALNRV